MIKAILLIFTIIFLVNVTNAQTNNWVGIYTFDEESWDENGTKSSRWFRLEVTKKSKKLTGVYSDGENSKTFRKFSLNIVRAKDKATFYIDQDLLFLTKQSRFHKGFLLFELRETGKEITGKPIIQTIWGKENLGAQSETGGVREGNIFFKKI